MKNLSGNAGNWDIDGKKEKKAKATLIDLEKDKEQMNQLPKISEIKKVDCIDDYFTEVSISEDIVATIADLRKKLKYSYSVKPIKETYDAIISLQDLEKSII